MMRVVHVVVAGEIGGAERMLVDLASRPDPTEADHSVAVLSPRDDLARLLRRASIRVHDAGAVAEGPLPFLRQSLGGREVSWLARILSRERAQIAHLHTFASHVVGTRAALRAGARILRTEHSTRAFDDPTCWPFSRWSLARTELSVAVSHHVRTVAASRAPWAAATLRVVPNGVDTTHFTPRPAPAAPGPVTFGAVGRLARRKGVDLAIRAVAQVPGARLEVIGDGAARSSLEALARSLGVTDRVTFRGFVDDTRPSVATCHAVLCSSRSEGLGVSLLEAMAMGRPVVAFRVGGVPEIVEDGRTGLLTPAGDLPALVHRMKDVARAPERLEALGAAARARVVERFSVEAMCSGYARAYADVLTSPPPSGFAVSSPLRQRRGARGEVRT
jgi:glycosyltransferase involved in cell wall biosynthesis